MVVNYVGMSSNYPYRIAEISFNESDFRTMEIIKDIMETFGWKIDLVTMKYALCEVDDKEEYKSFMHDWKRVKKLVRERNRKNMR